MEKLLLILSLSLPIHNPHVMSSRRAKKAYETAQLKRALEDVRENKIPVATAAKKHGVPRNTLDGRLRGHKPSRHAHVNQMLLSPAAEWVLLQWIIFLCEQGRPVSKIQIRALAQELCGKRPSKEWARRFRRRHQAAIKMGKASGLCPKRAQAFNPTQVAAYFKELLEVLDKYDIPWENVYNMDEKGCQRGGGRKLHSIKYFLPRTRRPHYKIRSDNLELVTIIECVAADGSSIKPGIVFSGKEGYCREWLAVDGEIK